MSETQEDIVIIEDNHVLHELHNENSEESLQKTKSSNNKIKFLLFGGIVALILLGVVLLMFLFQENSKNKKVIEFDNLDEKLDAKSVEIIEPSRLENMIAKANYLYTTGSKQDALSLYEKIAHFSEAISEYNLGVAQFKEKQYKLALDTFTKAIRNDEKRCVSSINAAVCALHLNDQESFRYFIDLAYAYLPHEIDSPLYSYYHALIHYYNQNYLAALNALKNPTSTEYADIQKNLLAKINAIYSNNFDAIEVMEKKFDDKDNLSIALLYARVGNYKLASSHLRESILKNIQPIKAQLALGLINLKTGNIKEATREIKNVSDMFPEEVLLHYPIRVKLKESLFDPSKAYEVYKKEILFSKSTVYQKIFYFSPYKIFNADQTISYIRKGNANIYIDNVKTAQKYLHQSSVSSSVNLGITKAIQKALLLNIREANNDLQELVKIQPKHSILQYNLALTYAQLGDLEKAHEHFLRSYYLDAKNYLSGIYAVMSGHLINKNIQKLHTILKESISLEEHNEEIDFYQTLLFITDNNYISAADWLNNKYKESPLYLALEILISLKVNNNKNAQKAATRLVELLPNDILPHILYIDSHFTELNAQEYALQVATYLRNQKFNYNDLYHGPYITRYLYARLNVLTGRLFFLREQLKYALSTSAKNTKEVQIALAMASFFDKQFEESYTLYNQLIDEHHIRDAQTLFFGAVASIGAGHHANAIALLELSKMKNTNFHDSRHALALLYLQAQNYEGATIQLSKINVDNFESYFFDFEIDTQKLLIERQNLKREIQ